MDSDWHDFLREVHRLAEFAPPILSPIEADWDAHGWHKKLLREAARRFFAERTPDLRHLPSLTPPPRAVTPPKPALAGGRPGLAPSVVLLFLMRRGHSAAEPQPKWRHAGCWGKSSGDERSNCAHCHRRPAGFSQPL